MLLFTNCSSFSEFVFPWRVSEWARGGHHPWYRVLNHLPFQGCNTFPGAGECAIVPRTHRLDKTAFLKRGSPLFACCVYMWHATHTPTDGPGRWTPIGASIPEPVSCVPFPCDSSQSPLINSSPLDDRHSEWTSFRAIGGHLFALIKASSRTIRQCLCAHNPGSACYV